MKALVFSEERDGIRLWGFHVGSLDEPLALMPPFAETPEEAARFAALFADRVEIVRPKIPRPTLVPFVGQKRLAA